MIKAHKIRLNPTKEQELYLWQATGVARYSFNWGLARYNEILDYNRENPEDKKPVSGRLLKNEFNKIKPEWVNEVLCWAYQGAFDDLQKSFSMFWKKSKNGTLPKADKPRKDGRPHGWPRFKSRSKTTPSFYIANTSLKFDSYFVTFDKKRCGPVNMTEHLRFIGKVMGGRVTYYAGQWWLSVQVEVEEDVKDHNSDIVGVDLGIKYLAVTSDGEVFSNPRPLQGALKKLRRLQRKLDRQRRANNPNNYNENGTVKNGPKEWVVSAKMKKTEEQITKMHYRIACLRKESSHQMTTSLTKQYGIIALEDLSTRGMMKNGRLSRAIGDAAFYEKRRQFEYKAQWLGGSVVVVDRWFPSSKLCNSCGTVNPDLKLSEREWICNECGVVNHRDGNAAMNIRDEAMRILYG